MISRLTRRVLVVNMLALGALVAGLLFLDQYEDGLVEAELASLHTQAEIFAGALGESAAGPVDGGGRALLPAIARPMLRRLVGPTRARARLFGVDGALVADSRDMVGPGAPVQEEALPPPGEEGFTARLIVASYEWVFDLLPARPRPRSYTEQAVQRAGDYAESRAALAGEARAALRFDDNERMVLIAAVPVQRFKRVLGALMLSTDGGDIRATVRDVRLGILKVFAVALGVTVILSLYLANAITRPVKLLAEAARRVKGGADEHLKIPDFTARRDEIGDLSAALRDMTADLWNRIEAVERFAADVSHEIKNPLTSLASAVETAARISDPAQQRRLMAIVQEDVRRLDRLISDISSASRLDAELARAEIDRDRPPPSARGARRGPSGDGWRRFARAGAHAGGRAAADRRGGEPAGPGVPEPALECVLVQPSRRPGPYRRDARERRAHRHRRRPGARTPRGKPRLGVRTVLQPAPRGRGVRRPFRARARHFQTDRGGPSGLDRGVQPP